MKRSFKVICLLLAAGTLFSSCGSTPASTGETEAPESDVSTETTRLESIPEGLDFGGAELMIYTDKDLPVGDYFAEQTGDIVDDALYARNTAVEERLNVKLNFFESPGSYDNREIFQSGVRTSVLAGDGAYDIVAGYSLSTAALSVGGFLTNLLDTKYLDFSYPWWSDSLIDCLSIQDRLYFASGDISTNTLGNSFAILFNKKLMADYHLEAPYALVDSGKWTLDAFFDMAKDIYTDLNANDRKDKDDFFGVAACYTSFDNLYYSCGLNIVDRQPDGSLVISDDWGSEKTVELVGKLCDFFHVGNSAYNDEEAVAKTIFHDGRAVFALANINLACTTLRDVDFDYGILPTPKWDEAQEDYCNVAAFTGAMYCIPTDAKDADLSSAVMEAMAMESYYTLAPAFFETAMKVKYTSDDDTARMFDIIKGTIMYDFGRMFQNSGLEGIPDGFRSAIRGNDRDWMSRYASKIESFRALLAKLTETLVSFD